MGAPTSASLFGDLVGDVVTGAVVKVGEGVVEGCAKLVSSVIPSSPSEPIPIQPMGIKLMDSLPEGSAEKVYQAFGGTAYSELYSLEKLQDLARPGSALFTYRGKLLFHADGDFEMRAIPDPLIQYFVDAKVITRVMWQLSRDLAFEEQ